MKSKPTMPPAVYHNCGSVTISLPYPPTSISPNASRGQSRWAAIVKSKIIKSHRQMAKIALLEALTFQEFQFEFVGYSLAHFTPTIRARDDDNADGSCKSYRDGIADALGVDDRELKKMKLSTTQKDAKTPRVEITIWTDENQNHAN